MRKSILCLIILLGAASGLYAQRNSASEIKRIAMRQLASSDVELLEGNKHLSVYGNEKGFVIINNHNQERPVIGYSTTVYNKERLPEGLKWWMKVAETTAQRQETDLQSTTRKAGIKAVEPFITTKWDQEKPYYYMCPKSNNAYCPTGCVATTLAQAMNYYQYPASAQGEGAYTLNEKRYTKKINSTYDWVNMSDTYKETDLRFSTSVQAVATLMRDCGYAVHMSYSERASGTSDLYMALALKEVFQYDSLSIKYYDRTFYTDEEWTDMVYASLEKESPVMYAGADEDGDNAHEFLLCGIDADGLVYVNWGWGGSGDGYYDLDMLKYFSYEFNNYQSMVIGMKPQKTPDATDKFESMWIAGRYDFSVEDENTLQLSLSSLYNYSVLDFNGTIDLTLVNKANKSDVTYLNLLDTREDDEDGTVFAFWGYYFIDEETMGIEPIYIDGLKDLAPGIYRMYLTSKEERDSKRQPVRNPGGIQYATLKKLSNGKILVSNDDVDDISTGIPSVRTAPTGRQKGFVYNLRGQRIGTDTGNMPKGIYIMNGKKTVH